MDVCMNEERIDLDEDGRCNNIETSEFQLPSKLTRTATMRKITLDSTSHGANYI